MAAKKPTPVERHPKLIRAGDLVGNRLNKKMPPQIVRSVTVVLHLVNGLDEYYSADGLLTGNGVEMVDYYEPVSDPAIDEEDL